MFGTTYFCIQISDQKLINFIDTIDNKNYQRHQNLSLYQ